MVLEGALTGHRTRPSRRALLILGPGLVTGTSDDDPSGVGTYAQAGASYGYATLFMLLSTPVES